MLMMMTVMRCPPERALLNGRTSKPRQDELKPSAGSISFVGEVAVISGCDTKHSNQVKRNAKPKRSPRHTGKDCGQTSQMNCEKRQTLNQVDAILRGSLRPYGANTLVHEFSLLSPFHYQLLP